MTRPKNKVPRFVRALYTAALFFAMAVPAPYAQTIHVGAGFDQQIGNGVAGLFTEVWLPNGWDVLSGVRNDGSVGFTARRLFPLGTLTLGDSMIQFSAPGTGLIQPIRGASLTTHGFVFFAGAAGDSFTEPFLATQNKFSTFGGGFTYIHKFTHGFTFQAATLDAKHKLTSLASLSETSKHFSGYLSGGELLGNPSLNYGANGNYWILFGSVARTTLIADNLRTDFTDESAGVSLGPVTVGASRYSSQTVSGDTLWALARIGDNTQARVNLLSATGERVLDLGILQKISNRISVSPGADKINGAWSWSLGGSFTSNPATVSLSYQEFFLPFATRNPWQKTLLCSVSLQLPHGVRSTVRSLLNPQGETKWTAYGDKYFVGPMGETMGTAGGLLPSFAKYVIQGTVIDDQGRPVFGAAVRVGRTMLYTATNGMFELRSKQSTQPLSVIVEEFSVGRWKIVDCPGSATANEAVRIVVARL
jgi:hypothetical protein